MYYNNVRFIPELFNKIIKRSFLFLININNLIYFCITKTEMHIPNLYLYFCFSEDCNDQAQKLIEPMSQNSSEMGSETGISQQSL